MRPASRRACSRMATWLRSEPGAASSAYLPGSTTPRSSAPSPARRRCRPASRSASGALAQPGTLVGAGGRRPRLDGADSRPILMPKNHQIEIHRTGPGLDRSLSGGMSRLAPPAAVVIPITAGAIGYCGPPRFRNYLLRAAERARLSLFRRLVGHRTDSTGAGYEAGPPFLLSPARLASGSVRVSQRAGRAEVPVPCDPQPRPDRGRPHPVDDALEARNKRFRRHVR